MLFIYKQTTKYLYIHTISKYTLFIYHAIYCLYTYVIYKHIKIQIICFYKYPIFIKTLYL